jgi:hypothetical protein
LKPYNKKFFAGKDVSTVARRDILLNHAQTCSQTRVSHQQKVSPRRLRILMTMMPQSQALRS